MSLEIEGYSNQTHYQGKEEECEAEEAHCPHTPASLSFEVVTDL